ncbi:MAG: nucleotidyltransferase domain-containing protein [Nitrososphaerota archaeon]
MNTPIEGDYIYSRGVGYLAVKGVIHPPQRIVAYPKYPEHKGIITKISSIEEAYAYLRERMPEAILFDDHSGQVLPQIPIEKITRHVSAKAWFKNNRPTDEVTRLSAELAEMISRYSGIDLEAVGLTGSALLGLQKPTSDIDLVFYSMKNAPAVIDALSTMRKEGKTRPVDISHSHDIATKRSDSAVTLEDWIKHESRKLLYGTYRGVVYSAKVVPLPEEYWEPYGSAMWREFGRAVLVAEVTDDSYSIYTPNMYGIRVIEIIRGPEEGYRCRAVASFRSRFAEQARSGEVVKISGRLEYDLKSKNYRIFIGNHRDDYILRHDNTTHD